LRKIDFDPEKLNLPEGWKEAVAELTKRLTDEKDVAKRAALIKDNGGVWSAIKHLLSDLSHGKCWYTEARQEGTDVDVDHFRPKLRVAELVDSAPPHPGYWWLAFQLDNYRYSCIVANRRRRDVESDKIGGKADHFPIWDEAKRAKTPTCDHKEEKPLLIDPCNAGDVALLTFKDDGEVMPRWSENHQYKWKKATKSIDLYHLNHSDFVKARIELRDRIEKICGQAKRLFNKLEAGDADHELAYEAALRELLRLRDKRAPYSGFCVAYLDRYRNEDYLDGVFR
jgi:hypothetical protein